MQLRVLRTSDLRPEGRLPVALEEIELLGSGYPLGMMRLERVVMSLRLRSLRLPGWDLSGMNFDLVAGVTPSPPPTRPLQITRARTHSQAWTSWIACLSTPPCCNRHIAGGALADAAWKARQHCVQGPFCRTHLNLRASD